MPPFAYQAVDRAGKKQLGTEDAATAHALERTLEARGLTVITLAPRAEAHPRRGFKFGRRREVLEVTRALAALLPAGMSLAPALGAASNVAGPEVSAALRVVRAQVERGEPLAVALAEHPHLFSPLYVGLVRAGERSGRLDEALVRLAAQLERDDALRSKLLSAMVYPILLAGVGGIAVLVLLFFVLPRFAALLENTGAGLPGSTAMLLGLAKWAQRDWYVVLAVPFALAMLVGWMRTTPEGKRMGSRLLLALPVVRTLRRYALAARFSRVVSVLLTGGAPLLTALDETIDSMTDPLAREEVRDIRRRIREGVSLRQAVAECHMFPPMLAQLIGVGEEAGRLRDFLGKAADIFEERTERAAARLATLAEPAMIVGFGAIVAFVALSLLQAIYGINVSSFK